MRIHSGRHTAKIEGDFVVFFIGMRINQLWMVRKWMPMLHAMPAMLAELKRRPELGLLHAESFLGGRTFMSIQYWRSFDQLRDYAHAKDLSHLPAWGAFNRRARGNKAVGIFHETYLVKAGQYECIHVSMPRRGFLCAAEAVPVDSTSDTARQRLGRNHNE
jgi:hypothetical protein